MTREDPQHSVLSKPWEYEIVGLNYQALENEPYLDLTLRRGTDLRRLRFLRPQFIELEKGFPTLGPSGIAIFDVRSRQLDGIGIRVSDAITGHDCKLTFWAHEVIPQ